MLQVKLAFSLRPGKKSVVFQVHRPTVNFWRRLRTFFVIMYRVCHLLLKHYSLQFITADSVIFGNSWEGIKPGTNARNPGPNFVSRILPSNMHVSS